MAYMVYMLQPLRAVLKQTSSRVLTEYNVYWTAMAVPLANCHPREAHHPCTLPCIDTGFKSR